MKACSESQHVQFDLASEAHELHLPMHYIYFLDSVFGFTSLRYWRTLLPSCHLNQMIINVFFIENKYFFYLPSIPSSDTELQSRACSCMSCNCWSFKSTSNINQLYFAARSYIFHQPKIFRSHFPSSITSMLARSLRAFERTCTAS